MTRRRAIIELVATASIWGFGFIAVRWSLEGMGALWIVAIRFLVAFALMLPLFFVVPGARAGLTRDQLWLAFLPGLFLCTTLVLQTFGLRFTTATNSGFVTCLYVLLVPPLARVFLKEPLSLAHLGLVAVALGGTALVCNLQSFEVNIGDVLTLACAVAAAAHIIAVSAVMKRVRSAFALNAMQCLWSGVLALAVAIPFEATPAWPLPPRALWGMVFTIVLSTILAFLLQLRAQRVLAAPIASILFLLESPFAALFAFLLLGERLGVVQWIGAALILASSAAAVWLEARTRKTPVSDPARISYEAS